MTGKENSYRNRIVLLGASNLTLSLRLIIRRMQYYVGGSSEIFVAAGHGRSYGQFSQVMFRGLPGITSSEIWRQIEPARTVPTYALITDIGNDIPYEYTPDKILNWIEWCVARLQAHSAQIVMTNIPIKSIERLSERRFNILRNLLYPYCQLSKHEVVYRANVIHQGLIEMAARHQFNLYEQDPEWFGSDGIHVSYWKRERFYQHVLKHFLVEHISYQKVVSKESLSQGWRQRPQFACKTIFGQARLYPQPSGRLFDDSPISLF